MLSSAMATGNDCAVLDRSTIPWEYEDGCTWGVKYCGRTAGTGVPVGPPGEKYGGTPSCDDKASRAADCRGWYCGTTSYGVCV